MPFYDNVTVVIECIALVQIVARYVMILSRHTNDQQLYQGFPKIGSENFIIMLGIICRECIDI